MKFDLEKSIKKDTIIFGNLPYNISSQIFVSLIRFNNWPPKYKDLILMFQKELGEKIIAHFPSSNYGRLAILSNLMFIKKFLVSPTVLNQNQKLILLLFTLSPK